METLISRYSENVRLILLTYIYITITAIDNLTCEVVEGVLGATPLE